MAAETITVYIDPTQLVAQSNNGYSLYLAKMVNGNCNVIWKALVADSTNPDAYGPKNVFNIALPSYQVNYTDDPIVEGSVTLTTSGISTPIELGQIVTLDKYGIFGEPGNNGTALAVSITNQKSNNPHAILLDNEGNPIFLNTSGMDITGQPSTMQPVDTYQVWFANLQDTGTIIASNQSVVGTVTFSDSDTDKSITFTANQAWEDGAPADKEVREALSNRGGNPIVVAVTATLSVAMTTAAATYLGSHLINKFSSNLKPSSISVTLYGKSVTVNFADPKNAEILSALGADVYETAVNDALKKAVKDKAFNMGGETWKLQETRVTLPQ
ncbi:hypothetical protein INH39_21755 [Massilia violaceinigra]|uniref:Uncharacterized protein n=1 Tax=Massilia violaceinigra TaxID=2045208 RepID=A0ABY4A016_9BURK|nr:hypothetical protein [Massilia violaceinigra]UOD28082.1 hypothetical protein INH39_21755 [Massilia violaceinigra]